MPGSLDLPVEAAKSKNVPHQRLEYQTPSVGKGLKSPKSCYMCISWPYTADWGHYLQMRKNGMETHFNEHVQHSGNISKIRVILLTFKVRCKGSHRYSVILSTRMHPMVRTANARIRGLGSWESCKATQPYIHTVGSLWTGNILAGFCSKRHYFSAFWAPHTFMHGWAGFQSCKRDFQKIRLRSKIVFSTANSDQQQQTTSR